MNKQAILKKFGKHLIQLRTAKQMSQSELAKRCFKDRQVIHRYEAGHSNPTLLTLVLLATELNISLKELLDFE